MKILHHRISSRSLQIAFCLPQLKSTPRAHSEKKVSAPYIQQQYIAAGLRNHGHKLTWISPRGLTEIVYMNDFREPRVVPLTWSGSHWFDLVSRGTWHVQRFLSIPYLNWFSNLRIFDACLQILPGHDLVYERNSLYRAGVAMACKWLRLPYILFFDADEIMEHDYMNKPITGLLRWRAEQQIRYNTEVASRIICVSEQAKTHLMTAWKVPAEKIVVFPNGVDVERFRPFPENRLQTRASLGINGDPAIIFVGNFFEWHDVTTLLNSFGTVLMTYPSAQLVLVGDGSQREAMMKYAKDIGVANAVLFTGSIDHAEIPQIVCAADIAVAPYPAVNQSLWLSPMKLFEYMACGTAVIATDVGQLAEVIEDGRNGLLVPPGDSLALAVALKRLIADRDLCFQLGQQARKDAVEKHSWEHYVSRLELVLDAVASNQPMLIGNR